VTDSDSTLSTNITGEEWDQTQGAYFLKKLGAKMKAVVIRGSIFAKNFVRLSLYAINKG
jgi:hypothetical protein